jgi:hypothetical protein
MAGHNGGFNPYRDASGRFASGPGGGNGRPGLHGKTFNGYGVGGEVAKPGKPGRGYRSATSVARARELKSVESQLNDTWRPVWQKAELNQRAAVLRPRAKPKK